jgi:hypothetical protein
MAPRASPADPAADPADAGRRHAPLRHLRVISVDADGEEMSWDELGYDRSHPRWVGSLLGQEPGRRSDYLQNMFAITIGGSVSAIELHNALFTGAVVNAEGLLESRYP